MPNIGVLHPQVVHFVVALGLVGVLLRVISLAGRGMWLNPAAATLLLLSAAAGVVAAKSGTDAHGVAERIPGAREAVQAHEEWGERTRNILLGVAALEILGLMLASQRAGRVFRVLSAGAGIAAAASIYETAEHGGELVYSYAGGVGTRSGDAADVGRLLVAGLFHGARIERDSGRAEEAARLTDLLAQVRPDDPAVKFLVIESKLRDRNDPQGALADLAAMTVLPDDPRLAPRHGILTAQALAAAGQPDSARALLIGLAKRFPQSRGVKDALDHLK
jgi:uncharacterized membrane protein